MISRLIRISILTLSAIALAGWVGAGSNEAPTGKDRLQATDGPVMFVQTAVVTWVDPPHRFGLDGGWTIELAEPSRELRGIGMKVAGGAAVRVKVVGRRFPGRGAGQVFARGFEIVGEPEKTGTARHRRPAGPAGVAAAPIRADHGSGGVEFYSRGLLERLIPPDRFLMNDGRVYRVDAATVFDPFIGSYSGLAEGFYLDVEAVRVVGGDNIAVEIEYEGDRQGGQGYGELEGSILAISSTLLELDDGTVISLYSSTLFSGDADSWRGVVPGWTAEVYGLIDLTGGFSAMEVITEDPNPATVADQDFEPQQALVVPVAGADVDAIAGRFDAEVVGRVGDLAVLLWWSEPIYDQLLAELTADPEVAAVEPNYLFRDPETVRRRYPIVDRSATTAELLNQPAMNRIRMSEAHQLADGQGIVVAVIDTGVDPLHPVLRRRLISGGLDLVDGDLTPWEERDGMDGDGDGDVDEATGHGTFVASLIAVAAPGAWILPYRVLDDDGGGSAYDLALALADAIQRRVDIINLSLVYRERSTAVDLLLERASGHGIVVVTSAGNDGLSSVPFPAVDSHTVAVAALSEDGLTLAEFSNRSEHVDLVAPGENVYGGLDDQTFGTSSGTSMAAPFVSATVAILLSADPGLDPLLVQNALRQAGVPIQDGEWVGRVLDMATSAALVANP